MPMRPPAGFISAFYDPLNNPNAPTIGTATPTYSSGAVSVTFTAPANVGGSAITSFTVIASNGITASGSASPITVTGLTNDVSYTFQVFATNSYGPGPLSGISNSATPATVPPLGAAFGGGYYAGSISTTGNGVATHYLVIAPKATGESRNVYTFSNLYELNSLNTIDGPGNTTAINNSNYPAAQWCKTLNIGGFTDWYLPAWDELQVIYFNLKPGTSENSTSYGANNYSVPKRNSNYTTSNPAQTSVAIFQAGQAQALGLIVTGGNFRGYWSSTNRLDSSIYYDQALNPDDGALTSAVGKQDSSFFTRAVRRVAV